MTPHTSTIGKGLEDSRDYGGEGGDNNDLQYKPKAWELALNEFEQPGYDHIESGIEGL